MHISKGGVTIVRVTVVVSALTLVCGVGVTDTQQEYRELEDFKKEWGIFHSPDNPPKKLIGRRQATKLLERRIVDPFIDVAIENNMEETREILRKKFLLGKEFEDSFIFYLTRKTNDVIDLRSSMMKGIITPILDAREKIKDAPSPYLNYSYIVQKNTTLEGNESWWTKVDVSSNEKPLPPVFLNSSQGYIALDDFTLNLGRVKNQDFKVTCTNGRYVPPMVHMGVFVRTSISHDCTHNLWTIFPINEWEIDSINWVYEIELTWQGTGGVGATPMKEISTVSAPGPNPPPHQLHDFDIEKCLDGDWGVNFTMGLHIVVRNKRDPTDLRTMGGEFTNFVPLPSARIICP